MAGQLDACSLIPGVLSTDDIAFLRAACKRAMNAPDPIPSYTLLDDLASTTYRKVHSLVEGALGEEIYYLNDFYLYSDDSFGAPWHMDTELFTFARCVNAWILLSPDEIDSPLSFVSDVNVGDDAEYHSVRVDDQECTFTNYRTRRRATRSLAEIEAQRTDAPPVSIGDILLLDPKRFHRTNTSTPKHAVVLKFLLPGNNGFMSEQQVPPMFWAEIEIFSELVRTASRWEDVTDGIRAQLRTESGRAALSAGFFPEKIDLYQRMAATL